MSDSIHVRTVTIGRAPNPAAGLPIIGSAAISPTHLYIVSLVTATVTDTDEGMSNIAHMTIGRFWTATEALACAGAQLEGE